MRVLFVISETSMRAKYKMESAPISRFSPGVAPAGSCRDEKARIVNEAVPNRMHEGLPRLEAGQMPKPPTALKEAAGEVVDVDDLGFIPGYLVDSLNNPNMISVGASTCIENKDQIAR